MNLIAAVDNRWAIGRKNELLVRIPNDQKYFREETTGKVMVITPSGMSMKKLCDPKYKTWIKGLLLFRATAYSIPIKYDKNVDISCKKYKIYKENLMEDRRSVHLDRSSSFFAHFNTFFTCYRK